MGEAAAKQGDKVNASDTHKETTSGGPVIRSDYPFTGSIDDQLSSNVNVQGKPAATKGSKATNQPKHVPLSGGSFATPPSDEAEITTGSGTVSINGKAAARNGDSAKTCNEGPTNGTVVATSTVSIG